MYGGHLANGRLREPTTTGGRHKSLCCSPEPKRPAEVCDKPYCELNPLECLPEDGELEERKRAVDKRQQAAGEPEEAIGGDMDKRALLEKRGKSRNFKAGIIDATTGALLILELWSRIYQGPTDSYGNGPRPNVHPTGLR